MSATYTELTTAEQADLLCFLDWQAAEFAGPSFDLAAELSGLDEAEQDEQARRESGYYDEADRIAFERMH